MLKRFHVWTTDFREFYVDAYSRHHAERKVAEITNGRAVIAGVREIRLSIYKQKIERKAKW